MRRAFDSVANWRECASRTELPHGNRLVAADGSQGQHAAEPKSHPLPYAAVDLVLHSEHLAYPKGPEGFEISVSEAGTSQKPVTITSARALVLAISSAFN